MSSTPTGGQTTNLPTPKSPIRAPIPGQNTGRNPDIVPRRLPANPGVGPRRLPAPRFPLITSTMRTSPTTSPTGSPMKGGLLTLNPPSPLLKLAGHSGSRIRGVSIPVPPNMRGQISTSGMLNFTGGKITPGNMAGKSNKVLPAPPNLSFSPGSPFRQIWSTPGSPLKINPMVTPAAGTIKIPRLTSPSMLKNNRAATPSKASPAVTPIGNRVKSNVQTPSCTITPVTSVKPSVTRVDSSPQLSKTNNVNTPVVVGAPTKPNSPSVKSAASPTNLQSSPLSGPSRTYGHVDSLSDTKEVQFTFIIDRKNVTIGRDHECNIRVNNLRVSRHQCDLVIIVDQKDMVKAFLNQLTKRPTTFLNNEAIDHSEMVPLKDGDTFRVYDKEFRWRDYNPDINSASVLGAPVVKLSPGGPMTPESPTKQPQGNTRRRSDTELRKAVLQKSLRRSIISTEKVDGNEEQEDVARELKQISEESSNDLIVFSPEGEGAISLGKEDKSLHSQLNESLLEEVSLTIEDETKHENEDEDAKQNQMPVLGQMEIDLIDLGDVDLIKDSSKANENEIEANSTGIKGNLTSSEGNLSEKNDVSHTEQNTCTMERISNLTGSLEFEEKAIETNQAQDDMNTTFSLDTSQIRILLGDDFIKDLDMEDPSLSFVSASNNPSTSASEIDTGMSTSIKEQNMKVDTPAMQDLTLSTPFTDYLTQQLSTPSIQGPSGGNSTSTCTPPRKDRTLEFITPTTRSKGQAQRSITPLTGGQTQKIGRPARIVQSQEMRTPTKGPQTHTLDTSRTKAASRNSRPLSLDDTHKPSSPATSDGYPSAILGVSTPQEMAESSKDEINDLLLEVAVVVDNEVGSNRNEGVHAPDLISQDSLPVTDEGKQENNESSFENSEINLPGVSWASNLSSRKSQRNERSELSSISSSSECEMVPLEDKIEFVPSDGEGQGHIVEIGIDEFPLVAEKAMERVVRQSRRNSKKNTPAQLAQNSACDEPQIGQLQEIENGISSTAANLASTSMQAKAKKPKSLESHDSYFFSRDIREQNMSGGEKSLAASVLVENTSVVEQTTSIKCDVNETKDVSSAPGPSGSKIYDQIGTPKDGNLEDKVVEEEVSGDQILDISKSVSDQANLESKVVEEEVSGDQILDISKSVSDQVNLESKVVEEEVSGDQILDISKSVSDQVNLESIAGKGEDSVVQHKTPTSKVMSPITSSVRTTRSKNVNNSKLVEEKSVIDFTDFQNHSTPILSRRTPHRGIELIKDKETLLKQEPSFTVSKASHSQSTCLPISPINTLETHKTGVEIMVEHEEELRQDETLNVSTLGKDDQNQSTPRPTGTQKTQQNKTEVLKEGESELVKEQGLNNVGLGSKIEVLPYLRTPRKVVTKNKSDLVGRPNVGYNSMIEYTSTPDSSRKTRRMVNESKAGANSSIGSNSMREFTSIPTDTRKSRRIAKKNEPGEPSVTVEHNSMIELTSTPEARKTRGIVKSDSELVGNSSLNIANVSKIDVSGSPSSSRKTRQSRCAKVEENKSQFEETGVCVGKETKVGDLETQTIRKTPGNRIKKLRGVEIQLSDQPGSSKIDLDSKESTGKTRGKRLQKVKDNDKKSEEQTPVENEVATTQFIPSLSTTRKTRQKKLDKSKDDQVLLPHEAGPHDEQEQPAQSNLPIVQNLTSKQNSKKIDLSSSEVVDSLIEVGATSRTTRNTRKKPADLEEIVKKPSSKKRKHMEMAESDSKVEAEETDSNIEKTKGKTDTKESLRNIRGSKAAKKKGKMALDSKDDSTVETAFFRPNAEPISVAPRLGRRRKSQEVPVNNEPEVSARQTRQKATVRTPNIEKKIEKGPVAELEQESSGRTTRRGQKMDARRGNTIEKTKVDPPSGLECSPKVKRTRQLMREDDTGRDKAKRSKKKDQLETYEPAKKMAKIQKLPKQPLVPEELAKEKKNIKPSPQIGKQKGPVELRNLSIDLNWNYESSLRERTRNKASSTPEISKSKTTTPNRRAGRPKKQTTPVVITEQEDQPNKGRQVRNKKKMSEMPTSIDVNSTDASKQAESRTNVPERKKLPEVGETQTRRSGLRQHKK